MNRRKTVKIKTRNRDAAEIKPSGKDVGKLVGLLPVNSFIQVAPLYFRNLQADMIKALKGSRGRQGYRIVIRLFPEAKKELEWWRDYLKAAKAKAKNKTQYSQMLLSKGGGHFNLAKIGGQWNMLVLKAAFLALKAFFPN